MKYFIYIILLLLLITKLFPSGEKNKMEVVDNFIYVNAEDLLIEGRGWDRDKLENAYDRLPYDAKDKVRKEVWELSKDTAGLRVRFLTNSSIIKVKWVLRKNFYMNHMSPTGIKGVDLYCKVNNRWQWCAVGRPVGRENESILISNMPKEMREFALYLPLYDGVETLYIGVEKDAEIKPAEKYKTKPLLFYGTSIVQGGCCSRPGMAYPAIIGRHLDRETINLGFSGNGRMDLEIAELISDLDVECYVLDPLPNMTLDMVSDRVEPFIKIIKNKKPYVPVVIIESIMYETAYFVPEKERDINLKNQKLKEIYNKLLSEGVKEIYYLESKDLIGTDHESTVDGVHLTDLGFIRISSTIEKLLIQVLKTSTRR